MIEKNTIQRILAYFFEHPTQEIHLRELARQVDVSLPSVLEAIKKLRKEALVIVTKKIAFTLVKANAEYTRFIRLKRISNLERLYESQFVDFLIKTCHQPQAIVCFGSYSRGEDTEQSDIDIAVLGAQQKEIEEIDLTGFERKLHRKISLHVFNIHQLSEEFKSNLSNGIVLEGAL